MHVLVAPDAVEVDIDGRHGPARLGAVDVAAHLAHGWSSARPEDVITALPQSDGSAGVLEVLQAGLGGESELVVARDAWGEPTPVTTLRSGSTTYLDPAPLLGEPRGEALRLASGGSSAGVGDLLLAAVRSGARRVVIGAGEAGVHDAGIGALRALGGVGDDEPPAAAVRAAAAALHGVEVVVAATTDLPLVGLSGAGAALATRPDIDPAAAQAIEHALAPAIAQVEAAAVTQTSLLAGSGPAERRGSRRPYAGAAGGLAFALAAVGARTLPGADVIAVETALAEASAAVDLVLTACTILDGTALAVGVAGVVGRSAGAALVPAVAIAPTVLLSRRNLSGSGIEASYPLHDPPPPGTAAPAVELSTALSHRASRVARTWSR